jgi:hypothetical protein
LSTTITVLSRSKRSNAGKAPAGLDEAALKYRTTLCAAKNVEKGLYSILGLKELEESSPVFSLLLSVKRRTSPSPH